MMGRFPGPCAPSASSISLKRAGDQEDAAPGSVKRRMEPPKPVGVEKIKSDAAELVEQAKGNPHIAMEAFERLAMDLGGPGMSGMDTLQGGSLATLDVLVDCILRDHGHDATTAVALLGGLLLAIEESSTESAHHKAVVRRILDNLAHMDEELIQTVGLILGTGLDPRDDRCKSAIREVELRQSDSEPGLARLCATLRTHILFGAKIKQAPQDAESDVESEAEFGGVHDIHERAEGAIKGGGGGELPPATIRMNFRALTLELGGNEMGGMEDVQDIRWTTRDVLLHFIHSGDFSHSPQARGAMLLGLLEALRESPTAESHRDDLMTCAAQAFAHLGKDASKAIGHAIGTDVLERLGGEEACIAEARTLGIWPQPDENGAAFVDGFIEGARIAPAAAQAAQKHDIDSALFAEFEEDVELLLQQHAGSEQLQSPS